MTDFRTLQLRNGEPEVRIWSSWSSARRYLNDTGGPGAIINGMDWYAAANWLPLRRTRQGFENTTTAAVAAATIALLEIDKD